MQNKINSAKLQSIGKLISGIIGDCWCWCIVSFSHWKGRHQLMPAHGQTVPLSRLGHANEAENDSNGG